MKLFDSFETECSHIETVKKARENAFDEKLEEKVCNVLKVLSEVSRLRIVLALSHGELCVGHIVDACKSSQSAVSHQLRILKDNRIIKSRRDGQSIVYSLDDEHIMQIIDLVKLHVEEE